MSEIREPIIRPMQEADLERAGELSAVSFEFQLDTDARRKRWRERVRQPLDAHPGGAFVAEAEGEIIGAAEAIRSDGRVWVLSLLAVDPSSQSAGAGRALLAATLGYAQPGDVKLIVASNDARAIRLYGRSGLLGYPTFRAKGVLRRSAIPAAGAIAIDELGPDDDLSIFDAVSRRVRGGAYGPELAFMLRRGGRLLHAGDRGFAIFDPPHGINGLLAADSETAAALFWTALAESEPDQEIEVRWLTGAQQWALDAVLRAGFAPSADGAVFASANAGTLAPYLPTGPFA